VTSPPTWRKVSVTDNSNNREAQHRTRVVMITRRAARLPVRIAPHRYRNSYTRRYHRETPGTAITLTTRNMLITGSRVSASGPTARAIAGFGLFWLGITHATD
jgi:hypothetical protein